MNTEEPKWGPTGKDVYDRTYSRTKPDGTKETWHDTVTRVVKGNLSLVPERFTEPDEAEKLYSYIYNFRIIPAGRHLWMSGVEGRQFLFNCYVSGWGDRLSDHFAFTFNQLMEGGGVGANYSAKYVDKFFVNNKVDLHIVCSPEHDDYEEILPYLSKKYDHNYLGAVVVEDSREGWTEALRYLIDTATHGTEFRQEWIDRETGDHLIHVVLDVSNIRAKGRRIKTFGGTSAGPAPYARMLHEVNDSLGEAWYDGFSGPIAMDIDHAIANCVVSGNVRRSARMSIMRWDDPWIMWFLSCKENNLGHWSTNISVEIDDEFIDLIQGFSKPMGWNKSDRAVRAYNVYRAIVEGMLTNGEPGIWNSSLANVGEPNTVIATNPCGEICLEEWENCNLGHVNLDAFVFSDGTVDYDGLFEAHRLMTRFLMRATYGDISDPRTRNIVNRNRRIGVGHFGFAGYLAKREIPYFRATDPKYGIAVELAEFKEIVDDEAVRYAHQLRIPVPVKTTTVAPTGTIAKLAGRSEGIHPVYARYFIRRVRYSMVDPDQARRVEELRSQGYRVVEDIYAPNTWVVEFPTKEALVQELEDMGINPRYLSTVDEIPLVDLLAVQAMYQGYYADNAISFTMNLVPGAYNVEEVMETLLPYLPSLKGTTIMVDESRELAPYERISANQFYHETDYANAVIDSSYDENCASGACPVR